jgi:hypothetical protein
LRTKFDLASHKIGFHTGLAQGKIKFTQKLLTQTSNSKFQESMFSSFGQEVPNMQADMTSPISIHLILFTRLLLIGKEKNCVHFQQDNTPLYTEETSMEN